MNFPYMYTASSNDSIDIEDIGNVCLNAFNDSGNEYFLSVDCSLGWVTIQEFGPLTADSNIIPSSFNYHYSHVEYDERKIQKMIDNFMNNPKRMITQIFEVDNSTVEERLNNLQIGET